MSAHRNSLSSLSTCPGSTFCFISGPLLKAGNCSSKVGSSFWQTIPMDIRSSHSRDSKFFSSLRNNSTIICHGPQLLISSEIVKGRRVTSWSSVAVDLRNTGADWVDVLVVQDGNIITARKSADLPRFNKAIIEALQG